jgi:hypothetical protein
MKSTALSISCMHTKVYEFYFYFPEEGEFNYYPATVIKDGMMICQASKQYRQTLKVLSKK